MEMIRLRQKNIPQIAKQLPCPSYNRKKLKTGIIHIGVGGFHRSHQAYYIHQLLTGGGDLDWGICGVGLREADRKIYTTLKQQDYLYTLIVQHPSGKVESEVVGSLTDFLLAVDNSDRVIDKMAHPDTKIVSLTITEGGYNFDPATGMFNFNHPDVQHELKHPEDPRTVYGFITLALRKRRDKGLPPFTVLSCDNIQHNGNMARKMLLSFANEQNAELGDWIENEVCFPNSMVDRITPVTTPEAIEFLENTYGLRDDWPVVCEPFIQWVVEDDFSNGRPEFEKSGVQFVQDVTPYEKMKIRLLNAGHSVLGIPGALHGFPTINACMEDEVFSTFMRGFMDKEATPVLDSVEGIDLDHYKDTLEERFANPNIKDSVSRICSESSAKLPKFIIPTLKENLSNGGSIDYATLIIAAWCYYSDKGVNQNNEPLEIIDEMQESLNVAARNSNVDAFSFIRQSAFFGKLIKNDRFTTKYVELVQQLYKGKRIKDLMSEVIWP